MSEPTPEAVEAAAKAMADLDDYDGCFLEVDAWESREGWEKEAHPESCPHSAYEDCDDWRRLARAALSAAAPYLIREAQAQALEDAAAHIYNDNICRGLRARAAAIRDGAQ